ncbi:error-prone DNA polymerase [Enterovirga aerilata]|uniref:Error-prone DNA polymerase n=1 Tax=Enterovirga aerilata TaxID=2730920 RepID=A0A849I529_9HYPH|nr:error-prone DNA polymerase [Enterovirga sp. DB1703]NNM72478.1 error-prone DNA polymerase [Enterovirga sp. DB1703]
MIPELQVTTHFSFLRGASSPEELFAAAALLGIPALGIVDRGSLAGIVRCWEAAKTTGVRMVAGTRLDLVRDPGRLKPGDEVPPAERDASLLVYPTDLAAYSRLTRLLSVGKARAGKGRCHLTWDDLPAWSEGLHAILLTDRPNAALEADLARLRETFGRRASCALTRRFRPDDQLHLDGVAAMAAAARVRMVATGDILYHCPERRILQDVVTCIRLGLKIDEAGFALEHHADRHLRSPAETERLFERYPEALARAVEIADACRFDLGELRYQYPSEVVEPGLSAQETLERLTWAAAAGRYKGEVPKKESSQLRHELKLIRELDYAPYFLTVHAIVQAARSMDPPILCQGRGSAANSLVCFVLGLTSIDPMEKDLLFERFVSMERREPPDIDVDFEHERREEVIQWVYKTYGRHRAALCATVIRYGARSAVREVGKVLGLPEDVTAALAGLVWGWSREGVGQKEATELGLNLADRHLRLTLELAQQLIDTPRHLSQHPGGFVLTETRLDDLVPIEPAAMKDRQVIEWDKDDIDALTFMKVDVLGLGMLGCMRRAFDLIEEVEGVRHDLSTVPQGDKATYAMIRKADTLGTFQIESRAQMAMLPRMKPKCLYDLVIQVAIVRPGPIQGDMVHPYLRRRENPELVTYPTPELERVLWKTLGVPLFQEQAMRVAIECAGFTPGEADQLRRAMATFKLTGKVSLFRDKLIAGMTDRGYTRDFAERTFKQIEGFGSYGFPESHAASFALIAYASAWVKRHHPDVFLAAILNSQPMGFYAPAQLVRDARNHGVEVLPPDVNLSGWDTRLEAPCHPRRSRSDREGDPEDIAEAGSPSPPQRWRAAPAGDDKRPLIPVRLGLRLAKGLSNADGARIVAARGEHPYSSIEELWRRAGVPITALTRLAEADAYGSLKLNRRDALWAIKGLADEPLPLFAAADARENRLTPEIVESPVALTPMSEARNVVEDYRSRGLSLRRHPLGFMRDDLARRGAVPCAALRTMRTGRHVTVAGLVLVRQKPGSAKGVMFITIEDETEVANLVIWPSLFERQRRLILSAGMIAVRGKVQREGEVIHVVADHLVDLSDMLRGLGDRQDEEAFPLRTGRGDEARHGGSPDQRDGNARPRPPVPDSASPESAFGRKARDIYIPDLRLGSGIKIPTRDFR